MLAPITPPPMMTTSAEEGSAVDESVMYIHTKPRCRTWQIRRSRRMIHPPPSAAGWIIRRELLKNRLRRAGASEAVEVVAARKGPEAIRRAHGLGVGAPGAAPQHTSIAGGRSRRIRVR